jgi:hypothetical protein
MVEILKGLPAGATVALDGAGFLTHNAAVVVKEPARPPRQAPPEKVSPRSTAPQRKPPPNRREEMTLPELSIRRHVLAWMLNAVLVLFGVISLPAHRHGPLPYIEFPVISVTTTVKGANPDIVDASVTNLVESSVNTCRASSTSSPPPRPASR